MELFIELIFRGLIVNFLGLYSRFYFFKLIGKKKEMEYLSGEKKDKDSTDIISQYVFNVLIGFIIFAVLSFSIAYLVWGGNGL